MTEDGYHGMELCPDCDQCTSIDCGCGECCCDEIEDGE